MCARLAVYIYPRPQVGSWDAVLLSCGWVLLGCNDVARAHRFMTFDGHACAISGKGDLTSRIEVPSVLVFPSVSCYDDRP